MLSPDNPLDFYLKILSLPVVVIKELKNGLNTK